MGPPFPVAISSPSFHLGSFCHLSSFHSISCNWTFLVCSGLAVIIAHAGDGYMWTVKSVQATKLIPLLFTYVQAAER
jgi:hypothetical protein